MIECSIYIDRVDRVLNQDETIKDINDDEFLAVVNTPNVDSNTVNFAENYLRPEYSRNYVDFIRLLEKVKSSKYRINLLYSYLSMLNYKTQLSNHEIYFVYDELQNYPHLADREFSFISGDVWRLLNTDPAFALGFINSPDFESKAYKSQFLKALADSLETLDQAQRESTTHRAEFISQIKNKINRNEVTKQLMIHMAYYPK